jgi:hypothetical protein
MAVLTSKGRNALPDSAFAGPGRSYPVNDARHAANAKSRASAQYNAGKISQAEFAQINRKANRKLGTVADGAK